MQTGLHDLDNPIWHALSGAHAILGTVGTLAGTYDPDIAPFAGVADTTSEAFDQLASMTHPDRSMAFVTPGRLDLPSGWQTRHIENLEQLICVEATATPPSALTVPNLASTDLRQVELGQADVADMLALAAATSPGPFQARTIRFGRYIGVRAGHGGELVAMAGRRLRLSTAVEISAVCTASSYRGQGLAGMLVRRLAAEALGQGLTPFLHVRSANNRAVTLYETLGFRHRCTMTLTVSQTPHR